MRVRHLSIFLFLFMFCFLGILIFLSARATSAIRNQFQPAYNTIITQKDTLSRAFSQSFFIMSNLRRGEETIEPDARILIGHVKAAAFIDLILLRRLIQSDENEVFKDLADALADYQRAAGKLIDHYRAVWPPGRTGGGGDERIGPLVAHIHDLVRAASRYDVALMHMEAIFSQKIHARLGRTSRLILYILMLFTAFLAAAVALIVRNERGLKRTNIRLTASEGMLYESERRLSFAVAAGRIGLWEWEVASGEVTYSRVWGDILGYPPGAVAPTFDFWQSRIHEADRERVDGELRDHLSGKGHSFEVEHRLKSASGEWVWVLGKGSIRQRGPDGAPLRVSGVMIDISRLKRAREDACRAEAEKERLTRAIEQVAEVVLITDTRGAIEYVNPAFERITGHGREAALGQNPRMLKSGVHDAAFYRGMWETIGRGETWSGRIVNRKKDGAFYHEEATISPVFDAAGRIVNFVAVKRDITGEIRMEEQLRQAQKMEAVGALAGGIAHDFNNILFPVMGYAEMLKEDVAPNTPQARMVEGILMSVQRARDLVFQILNFSRQGRSEKKVIRLQSVIKEVVKLVRSTLPSTIEIIESLDPECPAVMADATQIYQVAMNLVTNAFHAMEETGGRLEISLDREYLTPETGAPAGLSPGYHARLLVSDTGGGIDPSIRNRIFNPYFTTKEKGKGTGMGLSVACGILQSHAGAIDFHSRPGDGTTFCVRLPCVETAPAAPEAGEVLAEPIPGGHERILLVDDEPMIVGMLQEMLVRLGYRVSARTDSVEALELFRSGPERFDLVITDMTMPNITGDRLRAAVKTIRPEVPVIVITGFSEQIDEKSAAAMGFSGFVYKPVIKRDLAERIRAALNGPGPGS